MSPSAFLYPWQATIEPYELRVFNMMKSKKTHRSRVRLGFPREARDWTKTPAVFTDNRLEIAGHPVMETWEGEYMRRLAAIAGSKPGRVLEVGFGMGISARFLQEYGPEEHVIIEANEDVYERLAAFAAEAPGAVTPILGFWQEVTPALPAESFSSILFDTYPLSASEIHRNHFPFFREAFRLLKKGGILTYYSDEATDYSAEHLSALRRAGFRDIQKQICPVEPPADCLYWREKALLAPVIFK